MDGRRSPGNGATQRFDWRDGEIARLKREVAALRAREKALLAGAGEAKNNFNELSNTSRKFASSMRAGIEERKQYRRRLAAQYAISQVLARARDLDEAVPRIFETFGERLGWHAGALWKVGEDGDGRAALRRVGSWRSSGTAPGAFEAASDEMTFRRGEGLPGRVWERCEPVWVDDFVHDGETVRAEAAAEDDLHGALAFPVVDGDLRFVFELLRREVLPPDEDLMRTAALVGDQIGQFVVRRRAEGQRDLALAREREARERATSILESINDAFFALDGERRFTYVNSRAEELWGKTREELLGRVIWEVFPQMLGSEKHLTVEKVFREGESADFEELSSILGIWVSGRVYPSSGGVSVLFHSIEERKRAEEALKQSEARLSAVFSRAAVGLCELSLDGSFVTANDELCKILGRSREEILGSSVSDVTHPDDLPRTQATLEGLVETGETVSLDKKYLRPDGTVVWANSTLTRLDDEEGRPRRVLAVVVDLTERRRAEEAVRKSEDRYRSLAEATSSIVWTGDRRGAIVEEIPAWEAFTGQTYREYRGFGWLDALHPEDRPPENLWEELASSDPAPMEEEYRLKSRSGEYRRMSFRGVPITGYEGGTREWVGTMFDVEDSRRAEEEREELRREAERERARLETVLQQMPGGVFIAEPSGRFVLANEGATRIYGREIGSVEECGRFSLSYPAGEEMPRKSWPLARSLEGEAVSGVEHYAVRSDGMRRVVRVNSAPVRDEEGNIVAAVKAFEDVTRSKEAERALRESEEKLRTVVEGAPIILCSIDRAGVFTFAEGRGHDALGVEPGAAVGKSFFRLFAGNPEIQEDARRALRGESLTETRELRGAVWESSYAPLRGDDGEIAGAIAVAVDVTERAMAERERDRSREREREAQAAAEEAQRRLAFYAGAREERQIISRELHDRVAHSIAVVRQSLELYEVLRDRNPEAAAQKMEIAKEEAKATLRSTRDLSMMLRRSEVEDGTAKALAGLRETAVPPGVRYESTVTGDESLVPPHVGNQVFLVLREAVRNAVNHSGCGHVAVRLEITGERAIGTVEDDGRGFEPDGARSGGGLRSMEERASLVGGEFRLRSAPGEGVRIEVSVPLARDGGA